MIMLRDHTSTQEHGKYSRAVKYRALFIIPFKSSFFMTRPAGATGTVKSLSGCGDQTT